MFYSVVANRRQPNLYVYIRGKGALAAAAGAGALAGRGALVRLQDLLDAAAAAASEICSSKL